MLVDNKSVKFGDVLKKELSKNDRISIITSHLTIYAFNSLKEQLTKSDQCRILFSNGIAGKSILNELSGDASEISQRNQLQQQPIARQCADWIQRQVEIREMSGNDQLLPYFWHISKNSKQNIVIQGNSIFSSSGLGYAFSNNVVMNVLLRDEVSTSAYQTGFESAWANSENIIDIKYHVLEKLEQIYKDRNPQHLYYYTLYHIFKKNVDEIEKNSKDIDASGFKNSIVWNTLYDFQKDGVRGVIEKLEKYDGCILADSVGLGKTFEALAVIKYYELRKCRVLVIAPKKLRDNWFMYKANTKANILDKDLFRYDILNHTDLTRTENMSGEIDLSKIRWDNYDLVVIDESHNFRNSSSSKAGRLTRYSRLMNDILKAGISTKVLMLSATPVNNKLNDLKNQIAFITKGDEGAFAEEGIPNYAATISNTQKQFNEWSKKSPDTRTAQDLTSQLRMDYFKLLDMLTIARSRKHIRKYYSMEKIGQFPKRNDSISIRTPIDTENLFPSIKALDLTIRKLNLAPYSPLSYILSNKQEEYGRKYDMVLKGNSKFLQRDREASLVHLMRVNLLKRMESSIHSFRETVKSLFAKVDDLLKK